MPVATYTLGGITFNNGAPDADGVVWYGTLKGWNSAGIDQSTVDRPNGPGQIITRGHRSGKPLSLEGIAKAPTDAAYWAARNKLAALDYTLDDGTLVVNEPTPKRSLVRLAGSPLIERVEDTNLVDFALGLLAPDPRKYAISATSAAAPGTLTNAGSAPTPWVATLTGSTASAYLDNAGTRISFTGTLPAGTVVDSAARTVLSGATDLYGQVAAGSQWWELEPGANVITTVGAWTFAYRNAWL